MTESVRPPLWPQAARPSAAPARAVDPRAAFFGRTDAAPQPPAAQPAPVKPTVVDPTRPLRPGSLLNIRV